MNMYSQTCTVPYFPCNCQGRLLSIRVLVVRYGWVENKFPLGMVTGSDMVLVVGSCPIPMCKSLSSQVFFCFFPLVRKQDSNLIPFKLGTLKNHIKESNARRTPPPPPAPQVSDSILCGIR